MIHCLDARRPSDIYECIIVVYGEIKEIWQLWFELHEKYIIYIWNSHQIRVNPEKGGCMPEMGDKKANEFDREQFERFNILYT